MAMDRVQVVRPEQRIIERAAQVAQARISGSGGSTPAPAREVTSEGVDGNGDIFTRHPLIWGLDNWGDPASVWSEA